MSRRFFAQFFLRFFRDGFGVLARVDAVGDAEFDLVGVGLRVLIIETNDAVEIVDAFDKSISQKRLDDVTELKRVVFAVEISRQRDRTKIELKLAVFANDVAPDDLPHIVKRI